MTLLVFLLVERTKTRPLATGQVTEKEATILLATLLSSSLAILFQLNPLRLSLNLGGENREMHLFYQYQTKKRTTARILL
jgi:4-hydroxybenzoate polyprenyltransferase